jgi:hypothetical protein
VYMAMAGQCSVHGHGRAVFIPRFRSWSCAFLLGVLSLCFVRFRLQITAVAVKVNMTIIVIIITTVHA